jgi:uncharacterized protein (TIGR00369 family)
MSTKNPNYKALVAAVFQKAAFVVDIGMRLVDLGDGWVETDLLIQPKHFQHDGVVHGGVLATIADYTAGAAAATLVTEKEYVLTLEFKINYLRAAQGEKLTCRAEVLKPGSTFSVVESSVYAVSNGEIKLSAKAMVTMAVLPRS